MDKVKDLLEQYARLESEKLEIDDGLRLIKEELKRLVSRHDVISGGGFTASWKAGGKKYAHEEAAIDAKVSQTLIKRFTKKGKDSISWAKITKAADLPLDDYIDQGADIFEIKPEVT